MKRSSRYLPLRCEEFQSFCASSAKRYSLVLHAKPSYSEQSGDFDEGSRILDHPGCLTCRGIVWADRLCRNAWQHYFNNSEGICYQAIYLSLNRQRP